MPNTYSQIYYHIVFAVKNRRAFITAEIKDDLYKYITGIVTNHKQKLLIINGMPDHVHILLNCKPDMNLSALVREIKEHSTKYINDKKLLCDKFYWQAGFGAFSVSGRALSIVINYIKTQEEHHSAKDFKTEYLEFLKEYEIEYQEEYLFDFEPS